MRNTAFTILALAMLSAPPAAAAGFGGATVSENSNQYAQAEKRGVIEIVADRLFFSVSALRGTVGHSTGDKSESRKECTEAKHRDDAAVGEEEVADEDKVGPEPMYFGF